MEAEQSHGGKEFVFASERTEWEVQRTGGGGGECMFSMKRQMKGNTGAVKRCPKPNAAWKMLVDTLALWAAGIPLTSV